MEPQPIPKGYMENAQGQLTPEDRVSEIDKLRNAFVLEAVQRAQNLALLLSEFKLRTMGDIEAFVNLSGEKYGAPIGGIKGNVTLRSYDGRYKMQRAMADQLVFDERLQVAKSLIGECIKDWGAGANHNLLVLINSAFEVDREGNVNTGRILALRRHDIQDEKWKQAMKAISDSLEVAETKPYLRFYERQPDGSYKLLNLDVAKL
ncbi:DUF3164 family protein [Desulfuromonas acetoxidans]|uniref:DUF3164 family protein n=1 Tax=Desulfuromonas acetoxidans TaxID=891 RepID=UPI00292E4089|nr:DUF3164 family protein [Desulfuromonas acetoxidans]